MGSGPTIFTFQPCSPTSLVSLTHTRLRRSLPFAAAVLNQQKNIE